MELSASIVGQFFRDKEGVPTKAFFSVMALNHPLVLQLEPTNAFDPNAIKVLLEMRTLPQGEELDTALADFGLSFDELEPRYHIGYIAKGEALHWHPRIREKVLRKDDEWPAKLTFTMTGKPQATITID